MENNRAQKRDKKSQGVDGVIREGPTKKVIFKPSPARKQGRARCTSRGKTFGAARTSSAKALRQESAWQVWETGRMSEWLEWRE